MKAGTIKYIGRNDRNEPTFESEYNIGTVGHGYKTFWFSEVEDKKTYGRDDCCLSTTHGGNPTMLDAIIEMYEQMMSWDEISRRYA